MALDLLIVYPKDEEQAAFEAQNAPNKVARGREEDRFFILVRQHGGKQHAGADLHRWLQKLSLHFFDQAGSVTRALQAVIDRANDDALVQNLNQPDPMHPYAIDLLAGVLHYDSLLLVQAGNMAVAVSRGEAWESHSDPSLALQPLGLAAAPKSVLFQIPLAGKDLLALGRTLPHTGSSREAQALMDWLDEAHEDDPRLVLQLREGEGRVRALPRSMMRELWLQDADAQQPEPLEAVSTADAVSLAESLELEELRIIEPEEDRVQEAPIPEATQAILHQEFGDLEAETMPEEAFLSESEADPRFESVNAEADALQDQVAYLVQGEVTADDNAAVPGQAFSSLDPETSPFETGAPRAEEEAQAQLRQHYAAQRQAARAAEQARRTEAQKARLNEVKKTALRGVAHGAGLLNKLDAKTDSQLNKTDPKTGQPLYKPVTMLTKVLVAILVPLVIIIAAGGVYLARGRNAQFKEYLSMAQESARGAAQMESEGERQAAWTQVLAYLNRAEALDRNEESIALRQEAEAVLDHLDNATPIQFNQIALPFGSGTVQISQLAAYNLDLFALDQTSGTVLHFTQADGAYSADTAFSCGPGNYDGIEIGRLVAMTSIPINNSYRASLLALDAQGQLLYCGAGRPAQAAQLSAPEGGWGKLAAALYDGGRLMILDSEKARLWVYGGAVDAISSGPVSYFEGHDFDLNGAVDFAVSGTEAFILYEDGQSAHCISSPITAGMECENPAAYLDERGDVPKQDFALVQLRRLAFAPPPEAAINYLDSRSGRLYQFSLRLNLNSILRPAASSLGLPIQPVSAFLVTPNRQVFYAYTNQLFFSYLP